jgi:hypothetical protein
MRQGEHGGAEQLRQLLVDVRVQLLRFTLELRSISRIRRF